MLPAPIRRNRNTFFHFAECFAGNVCFSEISENGADCFRFRRHIGFPQLLPSHVTSVYLTVQELRKIQRTSLVPYLILLVQITVNR